VTTTLPSHATLLNKLLTHKTLVIRPTKIKQKVDQSTNIQPESEANNLVITNKL